MKELISIVVPVYNEQDCILEFDRRISLILETNSDFSFQIIYVDDGSIDISNELISKLIQKESKIEKVLITLSRNFGHQAALECGMRNCQGMAVITIDADLQDPPELVMAMLVQYSFGYDVVLAKREVRVGETLLKKLSAKLWYKFIGILSDTKMHSDVGDFRLLSRRALDSLLQIEEDSPYYRGLVSWIGFKSIEVNYNRDARYAGKTKYSFAKMTNLAISAVTNFSIKPLRLAFLVSSAAFATAFF